MTEKITFLCGTVLDEDCRCSLTELCRICRVNAELIHDMIDQGLIRPRQGRSPLEWRFGLIDIKRVEIALRLQQDLHVNLPGCALILDLLEEIDELRRTNRCR